MSLEGWLPITEYAGKYRVSISTLRRRIKSGEVEFAFKDGKYLLKDQPIVLHPVMPVAPPPKSSVMPVSKTKADSISSDDPSRINHAQDLLNEIKKTYSLLVQEKEQQLLLLRSEVADLRTLVKVLESENDRLKQGSIFSEPWVD